MLPLPPAMSPAIGSAGSCERPLVRVIPSPIPVRGTSVLGTPPAVGRVHPQVVARVSPRSSVLSSTRGTATSPGERGVDIPHISPQVPIPSHSPPSRPRLGFSLDSLFDHFWRRPSSPPVRVGASIGAWHGTVRGDRRSFAQVLAAPAYS